jgi:hypothetical protein
VLVLGVALGLVFAVNQLLGRPAEQSGTSSAQPAAAPAGSPGTGETPEAVRTGKATGRSSEDDASKRRRKRGAEKTPLAVPTGPCQDSDVTVTPTVDGAAFAGRDVTITLKLRTVESAACTWQVSPGSVVLRLTSGEDRIWSTQDCPGAIERRSVVVRKDRVTTVDVTWSGQRSDDECTRTTSWAKPGYYHATAAALGADPQDQQFRLLPPPRPTITPSPTAEPDRSAKKKKDRRED